MVSVVYDRYIADIAKHGWLSGAHLEVLCEF
jgi:hypothetical protein